MENQIKEKENSETQSGDPGRTPGSAEGDRETVEADLKEKNLSGDNAKNYDQTKQRKINESSSKNNS